MKVEGAAVTCQLLCDTSPAYRVMHAFNPLRQLLPVALLQHALKDVRCHVSCRCGVVKCSARMASSLCVHTCSAIPSMLLIATIGRCMHICHLCCNLGIQYHGTSLMQGGRVWMKGRGQEFMASELWLCCCSAVRSHIHLRTDKFVLFSNTTSTCMRGCVRKLSWDRPCTRHYFL